MLQSASKNPLMELADELQNGDKSLKDLYYEQLISDLIHLDDKEYVDDLDFDADEEFRDNSNEDKIASVASFNFTKNVMNKIREQSHLKQTQAKKSTSSTFGLYLGNFNKSYTDKETNTSSTQTTSAQTSTNYGGYFPQPKNSSQQSQWGGSQSLYSQTPEQESETSTNTTTNTTPAAPAVAPIAPVINNANTSAITKDQSQHSHNKHYILLAVIAFILSFIAVISINVYRNSLNDNTSSFNTLANVDTTSSQSNGKAVNITNTNISQNSVATTKSHVDTTISNSLYHSKIINLKQSLALSSLQTNLVAYHPTPILYGVKLISFRKEHQIVSKLVLKPKQAYNLSVLLNNYQIQRRLVN